MSWLSKIFGGKSGDGNAASAAEQEVHEGFTITPTPVPEGAQYRVCAQIEKDVDGEIKTHQLIRADMLASYDAAVAASIRKAKQVIDEQGDAIFR